MKDTEKIKSKIKNLLSKTTDSGATKAEMESALKKANQLMTNFFISENDIKDSETISKCVSASFDLTRSGFDLSLFYADLAHLFDCNFYFNKSRIVFFGHKQDVDFCGYFYYLITRTCLKEKDIYLKSSKCKELKRRYHAKTLSASFIKGFLIEIIYKMQEMYKNRERNIPSCYGLMIIKKREMVKNEFEKLNLNIKIERDKKLIAKELAFNDGKEKGSEISLIQGVETSSKTGLYLN